MKKNTLSYSLWGEDPKYWVGALENIKLARRYYPEWISIFYVDKNSKSELIKSLEQPDVEIILVDSDTQIPDNTMNRFKYPGIFWRFTTLSRNSQNINLFRDCDSRISQREVDAVNEWLVSDKKIHIMRDHPYHRVPILAGMWGARDGALENILDLLQNWRNSDKKEIFQAEDQDFLGQVIYPIVKDISMEHSEFGISFGGKINKFPTKRNNFEFVGDVFDDENIRHPEYWTIIKKNNK